jgi:predicted phage terminase large subunit-like protein
VEERYIPARGIRRTQFVKAIVQKALKGSAALWPEMFPPEELKERRRQMGSVIFDLQYQNDACKAQGAIFSEEWLKRWDRLPETLTVYQGVDLAISDSALADYFAIVTIGISEDSAIHVIDTLRARLTFEKQARTILNKALKFEPVAVAIEAVGYQMALSQVLSERTLLPVKPIVTHKNKIARAWRLSALFESGKILLGPGQEELMDELLEFPNGEHDDLFDALEMAVATAHQRFQTRLLRISGM